jgi:HSP20 family molecular chaperone IbpA
MQHYANNPSSPSVYPGNYVPKHTINEITEAYRKLNDTTLYPVKMKELKDFYQLEIEIPGAKNEDFVLEIDGDTLCVCMLHEKEECFEGETFKLETTKSIYFRKQITLPTNADTIFISAEYKAGILYLMLPKTEEHTNTIQQSVIVY